MQESHNVNIIRYYDERYEVDVVQYTGLVVIWMSVNDDPYFLGGCY